MIDDEQPLNQAEIDYVLAQLGDTATVNDLPVSHTPPAEPAVKSSPKMQLGDEIAAAREPYGSENERDQVELTEVTEELEQHESSEAMRRMAWVLGQQRTVRRERHRRQGLVFREAEANAVARIRAERKRAKDAERQQQHRVSRQAQFRKHLEKLVKTVANPRGSKFLEQLRGREVEIARFYVVLLEARDRFGDKVSGAKLAELFEQAWDAKITRFAAISHRKKVAKLEAKGGPWGGRASQS